MDLAASAFLAARHARLREAVAAAGCDALLVTRLPNLFYLANLPASSGLLLLTASELFLVVDFRYLTDARDLLASPAAPPGTTLVPVEGSYDETLVRLLESVGPRAVGFEAEDVSVARHAWLRRQVPGGIVLQSTEHLVEQLRETKDAHETTILRRAAKALSAILPAVLGEVAAGRREREVAGAIEAAIRSSAFSRPAFDTIVGSGPNGARPHAAAGDRRLAPGDLVVLDFGGVMDGYCVDMTRTVTVGPAGSEARRVYDAVRRAQEAAIAAVRPSVRAGDIDLAARDVLREAGLGEAFGHGTGHGLGIEVHEGPRITRLRGAAGAAGAAAEQPVGVGMVFTVEPGAYLPGWGGVRIEDDVLVTPEGCEVLTDAARELIVVGER
jgi:Xaa-Pro aminopeptidase